MSSYVLSIITDLSKFEDRINEFGSEVTPEMVKSTVASLKRTLIDNPDLVGLCAPQIGSNIRIFAVKTAGNKVHAFLNPIVVKSEGLHLSREVNASMPGKEFIIPRRDKVHIAYQDVEGRPNSETYTGPYGEMVQQMIEMLDGILLSDYGLDLDDVGGPAEFDKASKKNKEEVIAMYLESLKSYSTDLAKAIEESPELKNMNDTIDFITRYLNGEIKPVDSEGNIVEPKPQE